MIVVYLLYQESDDFEDNFRAPRLADPLKPPLAPPRAPAPFCTKAAWRGAGLHRHFRLALRALARPLLPPRAWRRRRELQYRLARAAHARDQRLVLLAAAPFELRRVARRHAAGLRVRDQGRRYITHMLKLRNVDAALANFFASGLFELGEKLGPDPLAVPAHARFDAELFEAFFQCCLRAPHGGRARWPRARPAPRRSRLPRARRGRCATRSRSATKASSRRRSSPCCAGTDRLGRRRHRRPWPLYEDLTADFVYLRLHGYKELYASGYDDEALDRWAGASRPGARAARSDDARLPRRAARRASAAATSTATSTTRTSAMRP